MMDASNRFNLCLKELEAVQANIARYDTNGLQLKGFCITVLSAISIYAIQHKSRAVEIVGIFVILAFFIVELVYRCYQLRFMKRSGEIEALLATNDLSDYHYGLDAAARTSDWSHEIGRSLVTPQFMLLYIALFIGTAVVVISIIPAL